MELPELNIETIWAIINDEIDDETVNKLVWQSLGYRYDESQGKWDNSQVEEDWRGEYPQPPDFIGGVVFGGFSCGWFLSRLCAFII